MDDREAKFYQNKKIVEERKAKGVESYNNSSRSRLEAIAHKKIDTTMIGAISTVEKEFGELMNLVPMELKIEIKNIYDKIRSGILDNGNRQKRGISEEISQYTITWNRYNVVLPVKNRNEEGL